MSLNWKEIDLVLSELPLRGSHIQDVRQPDFKSLLLELYRPGDPFLLYANLSPEGCRLQKLSRKPRTPKTAQRFVEFLRARVRGGRIAEARQLGSDRIVKLAVIRGDETTFLYLRLWGGASNILATEADGTILDAFYRRPKRGEETGGRYDPEASVAPAKEGADGAKVYEVRPHPEGESFNSFIERFYGEKENSLLRKRLMEQIEARYRTREAKLQATLRSLSLRRDDYRSLERFKRWGDLVMANLHAVKKGDGWLRALDYGNDGSEVDIELDPSLGPYENAEAYYRKYKKAKAGLDVVEEEIAVLEREAKRLALRLEELETEEDVEILRQEIGKDRAVRSQVKEKNAPPGLRFESGGFTILVGRSSAENDELLRRHVRGNDFWLHTRDCPGAYVFIKAKPGKSIPLETLLDAGNLAVHYSKARASGNAELYYTQVKHLRRAKGEKTGTVLPTHEKNLAIRLDPVRLDRLGGDSEAGAD